MYFSRCMHYFGSSAKLEIHTEDCGKINDYNQVAQWGQQVIELQQSLQKEARPIRGLR